MSTSTTRAVRLTGGTAPEDLEVTEVPLRAPRAGELVVEVRAAAVNRSDVVSARGLIPLTTFPRVPGRDFAGVVVDGPAGTVGQEVWGTGGGDLGFSRDGSHAQHLQLPATAVVPVPGGLSFDEAGSAGLVFLTASLALDRAGEVAPGTTVLVTGAVGGVGSAVVALVRSRGGRVIGAVSGADERARAEAAGIDTVVDTREHELSDAVAEATGGTGAALAVDTVGAPLLNAVIAAMATDGGICFIASQGLARADFDPQHFYRRDLRLTGLNTTRLSTADAATVLRPLVPAFEAGDLAAPTVTATHGLDAAATAYAAVDHGTTGRVVLHPHD